MVWPYSLKTLLTEEEAGGVACPACSRAISESFLQEGLSNAVSQCRLYHPRFVITQTPSVMTLHLCWLNGMIVTPLSLTWVSASASSRVSSLCLALIYSLCCNRSVQMYVRSGYSSAQKPPWLPISLTARGKKILKNGPQCPTGANSPLASLPALLLLSA